MNSGGARIVTAGPQTAGYWAEVGRRGTGSVTVHPDGITIENRIQPAGTADRTISAQGGWVYLVYETSTFAVLTGDIA